MTDFWNWFWDGALGMVPPKYEDNLPRKERVENRIKVNNFILGRLSRGGNS